MRLPARLVGVSSIPADVLFLMLDGRTTTPRALDRKVEVSYRFPQTTKSSKRGQPFMQVVLWEQPPQRSEAK